MERLDLAVTVELPDERLPAEIETSTYFIVAEALTNIVKHAHAESAAVSATVHDGTLELEVRDDGIGGADPRRPRPRRAERPGRPRSRGRFSVQSPTGSGTVLFATLPISQGIERRRVRTRRSRERVRGHPSITRPSAVNFFPSRSTPTSMETASDLTRSHSGKAIT